jgi:hypothetical protein
MPLIILCMVLGATIAVYKSDAKWNVLDRSWFVSVGFGAFLGMLVGFIGLQIWHGMTGSLAPCWKSSMNHWSDYLRRMPVLCKP